MYEGDYLVIFEEDDTTVGSSLKNSRPRWSRGNVPIYIIVLDDTMIVITDRPTSKTAIHERIYHDSEVV